MARCQEEVICYCLLQIYAVECRDARRRGIASQEHSLASSCFKWIHILHQSQSFRGTVGLINPPHALRACQIPFERHRKQMCKHIQRSVKAVKLDACPRVET